MCQAQAALCLPQRSVVRIRELQGCLDKGAQICLREPLARTQGQNLSVFETPQSLHILRMAFWPHVVPSRRPADFPSFDKWAGSGLSIAWTKPRGCWTWLYHLRTRTLFCTWLGRPRPAQISHGCLFRVTVTFTVCSQWLQCTAVTVPDWATEAREDVMSLSLRSKVSRACLWDAGPQPFPVPSRSDTLPGHFEGLECTLIS